MNRSAVGLWSRWSKRRCCDAELPRAAIRASETRPLSVLAPKQKDVFDVWMEYVSRLRGCLAGTDEGDVSQMRDCRYARGLVVTEADDHYPASSQARGAV